MWCRANLERQYENTYPAPSKTGVTGVTRVTSIVKRPVSLTSTPVTQFSDIAYIRCNAAPACNAKISVQVLRADVLARACQATLAGSALKAQGVGLSVRRRMRPLTDRQTVLHSALSSGLLRSLSAQPLYDLCRAQVADACHLIDQC